MPAKRAVKSKKEPPVSNAPTTAVSVASSQPAIFAASAETQERFIKTRKSNTGAHPGQVQVEADAAAAADEGRTFKLKLTPEEAKAAKVRAAEELAQAKERRKATVAKIAALQQSLEEQEAAAIQQSLEEHEASEAEARERLGYMDPNNLPLTEGDSSDIAMRSTASSPPASDAEGDSMVVDRPVKKYRYFGLASESDEEDSDYKPDAAHNDGSEVELGGNMPDTAEHVKPTPAQTSSKKPAEKKSSVRKERALAFRQEMEAAKAMEKLKEPLAEVRKRKTSINDNPDDKKKKKNTGQMIDPILDAGLRSDWREIAARDAKPKALMNAPDVRMAGKLTGVGFKTSSIVQGRGGFDDDAVERATGASSLKASRETKSVGIKIEYNKPKEAVDGEVNKTKTKSRNVVNADLELSPDNLRKWQKMFLPTLYAYIGNTENPWEMGTDEQFLKDLRFIYTAIFPHQTSIEISPSSIQYRLAAQRAYEWRNAIGDAAEKAVKQFWTYGDNDDLFKTLEERAAYARDAVGPGLRFLYDKPNKKQKIFRTRPILYTFGHYLHVTAKSKYAYGNHEGGLALSAAAVHRVFEIAAGLHKQGFTFSYYGVSTKRCLEKAKQLTESQWNDIFTQTRLVYEENTKAVIEVDATDEDDEWDDVLVQESSDGPDE